MPKKWEPEYWFLDGTDAELDKRLKDWTKSYPYVESDFDLLEPYTSDNKVEALVDGEDYMSDLLRAMGQLASDEHLFITGWEFSKKRFLDKNNQPNTLLHRRLRELAQQGVKVKLIAFHNRIPTLSPEDFIKSVNKFQNGIAVMDGTTLGTSHHEKVVFVGRSTHYRSCAYVGGIDLSVDRHDNSSHNRAQKEERQWGWHDIAVKVSGKAIMQLWANFVDRWDSIHLVHGQKKFACPRWAQADGYHVEEPESPGTQHVQVLRTVGHASPRKLQRYMPTGERTVYNGLSKAISKAERYIYIEEQFVWDGALAVEIASVMKKKPDLHLIIVLAAETDMPARFGKHNFYLRTKFFKRVLNVPHANQIAFGAATRIHPFGLYRSAPPRKAIYVHSKLIIIDDRFVSVGSANVNERSMSIDTEMTLGIVDGETEDVDWYYGRDARSEKVCTFAKNLREKLWEEHSGVSPRSDDPMKALVECFPPYCDPSSTFNTPWPATKQAAKLLQKGRLRCYVNKAGSALVTPAWGNTLDRTTRTLQHN